MGAPGDDNTDSGEGAVYVLMMNSDGTVKRQLKIGDGLGGLAAGSLDSFDNFGDSIAGLGDLNEDDVADLAVGAFGDGNMNSGAVYMLFLSGVETLTVSIDAAAISENVGATTATVTRSNTDDLSQPLTVNLLSDDTSEATVHSTVTIAANQNSATFDINAEDDIFSGPHSNAWAQLFLQSFCMALPSASPIRK